MEAGEARGAVALVDDGFAAFCHGQHRRLVGMLGLYCGDVDVAEELAQEAMARLCRQWRNLPTEGDAARWLTRVALNLAKSSFRSRATRGRILERYGHSLVRTESRAADGTTAMAVRAAVARLPERQRKVVILRYFCDLAVADVAEILGCPEGTVKSLTSQAIAGLRRSGLEVSDD